MDDDQLIALVRARAIDRKTRTDFADRGCPELAPCATAEAVAAAERAMGAGLHDLHRRLLMEVGNGGFGPGDGLIGLPGGRLDDDGRSLIELREYLSAQDGDAGLPRGIVPLVDWGDAIWSCLDGRSGRVLTLSEAGLFDLRWSLSNWLAKWVAGTSLWAEMFSLEEKERTDPFTKKPITFQVVGAPKGTRWRG